MARLPSASAGSARDLARLGRLYMEEMARLSRPWLETLRPGPEHLRRAMAGDHSALIKFADLAWDACERTFGRLLESPSLGFTRELTERTVRAFAAWLDLRRTAFEYQVTLAGAFPRIWQELVRELGSRSASGKGVATLRELLGLWSETADRVLVEVFGSEEYARIQGRLLNAAMAYRIQEREAADSLLRMGHLPTRREVDEAGRMIHALRKELRRLERSLQGAERAVAPSQDDEAAPPPRARDGGLPPARSSRRGATRREGEAGPSPPGRSRKQGLPGEGAPAGARGGESSDAAPREKGGPPEGAEGR